MNRAVASSIIGGGGLIFIYSGSAQLISFEINCLYGLLTRIYEYQPPNYRACYGPDEFTVCVKPTLILLIDSSI